MALPMLAGGAECGPSNPLQTLAKRFDHDRGLQQVCTRTFHVLRSSRFIRITLESTGQDLRERYECIKFLSTATDGEPSRSEAILQDLRLPTKGRHNFLHHSRHHMPS